MFATVLGWVGTAGTLGAYLMLSRGRLSATSTTYALLNVVGGLLAGSASAAFGAWPSATANVLWAAISLRTLLVGIRRGGPASAAVARWQLRKEIWQLRRDTLLRRPVSVRELV